MKRKLKRAISTALSAVMLISSISFIHAEEPSGTSYFDFEYANYDVNENDGQLKVKIKRFGNASASADVAFKAADFLSTYGKDYEILNEEGTPLEKVSGVKPDPSEFVYDESTSGSGLYVTPEASDTTVSGSAAGTESNETVDPSSAVNKEEFGGSSLLAAQAQYLDLPKSENEEETLTPDDIQNSVSEMYKYFDSAEGAEGIVHFEAGESEKEITIVVKDNDTAESDKMFMLAILAAEGENVETKANATTYVSIIDNEEREETSVSIDSKAVTLTKDVPTAEITVRRTSGLQYFTSVYVSTVDIDDCKGAYEEIEYKTVAFVPGETEKTITVKAEKFDKNTKFGVKLSGYDDVKIGNSLVAINISKAGEENTKEESSSIKLLSEENSDVELLTDGNYLGNAVSPVYSHNLNYSGLNWKWEGKPDGGWFHSGHAGAWMENGAVVVDEYGKDSYSFIYSQKSLDTVGISRYAVDCYRRQDRGGYGVFESDTDQTWVGSINSAGRLQADYQRANLWLTNGRRDLYLKLGVTNHSNHERTEVKFDNLDSYWTRYTFEKRSADTKIQRKLYDFTTGNVMQTYFDGEKSKTVSLDGLNIKDSNGSDVAGFYGDTGSTVVFTAPEDVTKYGYVLDKVYFYNNAGNKYVAKSADENGVLKISAGQSFLGELYNNGVINLNYNEQVNGEGRSTIYVKPTYKPDTVRIAFYKANGFVNLDADYGVKAEEWNDGQWKCIWVPRYSVVRVQYIPAAKENPKGVKISRITKAVKPYQTDIVYYKEGEQIWSTLPDRQKENIGITDFTKAEFIADSQDHINITSNVGAQNLYIGYAPQLKDEMKTQLGGSLASAVFDSDEMMSQMGGTNSVAGSSEELDTSQIKNKTDEDGKLNMSDVALGNTYNFRSFAPNGYYTSWADMTGDTNNDGKAFGEGDESKTPRNYDETGKTNNYRQVIGSRVNLNLERDNTRYYYAFLPAVMNQSVNVTGKLQRRKASLLQLSRTRYESDIKDLTPISDVFVSIAENSVMPNKDGSFSVPLIAPLPWGAVSAYYTVDGIEYAAEAQISGSNNFVVPAMSRFETVLNSVKATYANDDKGKTKAKHEISDGASIITCYDDKLTIEMAVKGTNQFKPTDAKFSIYDLNGNYLRDADSSLFTVKKEIQNTTNQLKVSVTFNAKAAMNSNEELYVQFADQNGKWYNTLSTGYKFISELNLAEFIFPLIGADNTSEGSRNNGNEDIIGNPLGNFNIGRISKFTLNQSDYLSPGAEQYKLTTGEEPDAKYKWSANTYSIGYKKEFSDSYKYDSKKEKEKAEKAKKEAEKKKADDNKTMIDGFEVVDKIEEDSEKVDKKESGSNFNTKSSFKWSVSPFVSFRLTLTQRPVTKTDDSGKESIVEFKPYFEDLAFMVGVKFDLSTSNTISTPIGIDVIIEAKLDGTIAGVYHMWSDYKDDWQIEGATPYTYADFGIFNKFGPDSAVRREAYIFIDPAISVTLGISIKVAKLKGNAKFTFDMDFQFTDEKDAGGDMVINYYGDMKIDLKWWIEVLGFEVYSKKYDNIKTVELFKQNADKHINLETADEMIKALSADEMTAGADEPIRNDPVSRAYLKNRGGWNTGVQLMSSATTTESVLQSGSAGSNDVQTVKINDNEILMLFIDDSPNRNNVNKRALYYTIGNGTSWSQPVIVKEDGTMDDYPTVQDLGDGRIFVAWSSASKTFEEGATVEEALRSLDIQAVFFDKTTKTFGEVETLTKTTKEDYTADIYPHTAYDPATQRLILYYTKTEYKDLDTVESLSKAVSANAYLFYENGKWCNEGSAYSDEELNTNRMKQMAAENNMNLAEYQNYYKEQWYGQRFLDLRLSNTAELARVAETDAMYYNGLGIFAWTADWDNDLSTAFDRDVFVQIYNFSENTFTHIIRVTDSASDASEENSTDNVYTTGGYYNPVLRRSAEAAYLFFGTMDEEDEIGGIVYVDLSRLVAGDDLTKITDGGTNYYVPNVNPIKDAVETKNVMDYDLSVNSNGKIYLFWTNAVKDGSLDIMASMLNDSEYEDNAEDIYWSEAVQLTDAADGIYYMDLGSAVINDIIYIGAGRGNYNDDADNNLVVVKHIPAADVTVDGITPSKEHFKAGEIVEVSALLRNKDLLTEYDDLNVVFTVNGREVDTKKVEYDIPGGFSTEVTAQIEMPDNPVDIKLGAYVEGTAPYEITVENGADVEITERSFEFVDRGIYIYRFTAVNNGGKPSEAFKVTASYGQTDVEVIEVPALSGGETRYIEMPIVIDDDEFEAERETTQMTITAVYAEKTILQTVEDVYNPYYWDAVDAIAKVTDIKFEDSYTVKVGDSIDIQPVISGVDTNTLRVLWLTSSNYEAAEIDAANVIYGDVAGKSILTGILVPYDEVFFFSADGTSVKADWCDRLPESSIVTVTAVVNVVEDSESTKENSTESTTTSSKSTSGGSSGRSSGGGNSSSKASGQTNGNTVLDDKTAAKDESENGNTTGENNGSGSSSKIFNDIAGHWAESIIAEAAARGIVSGYKDGSFKPNNSITRAEFVAMLYNSSLADTDVAGANVSFNDVTGSEWYAKYLEWAVANDIIEGYEDNTFRGGNAISRQEMAVVVSKFIVFTGKKLEDGVDVTFTDEADIASWAKPYVDDISSKGIVKGDNYGKFVPKKDLTRAETAVMITRVK